MDNKSKNCNIEKDLNDAIGYRSPCRSLQYSGESSPGQGRSVREFEETMESLRKENFNLKLRIYFLEEKIPAYNPSTNQQQQYEIRKTLFKQNIDLKVENEVLRKELQEMHTLLCEAGKALELMEQQQKLIEEQSQTIINELYEKIRYLESENRELEEINHSKNEELVLNDLIGNTKFENNVELIENEKTLDLSEIIHNEELKTTENHNVVNISTNNDDSGNGSTVMTTTTTITVIKHDCAKVDKENAELRCNLKHTKLMLESTWSKLKAANQRKENIERDLRQQIQKTQKVLSNARINLENEMDISLQRTE